jgi:hypothetical protein
MTVYEMSHENVDKALKQGTPPSFANLLGFEPKK